MKKLSTLILLLLIPFSIFAQTKLTDAQQNQFIDKIDKAVRTMTSMQCDFVQTKSMKILKKEMKSTGMMYYKNPEKLRWQYTSPYDYTFVLNGSKVSMKSAKSTKTLDIQGNKMFRQITNIILNCITGGSLKSSSDFKLETYKKDKTYFAKLYPKKKELKQIYNYIELYFSPENSVVDVVKMYEKTGDVTTVKLNNIKINSAINEKFFAAD